jgi:hypothetical protein
VKRLSASIVDVLFLVKERICLHPISKAFKPTSLPYFNFFKSCCESVYSCIPTKLCKSFTPFIPASLAVAISLQSCTRRKEIFPSLSSLLWPQGSHILVCTSILVLIHHCLLSIGI